MWPVVGVDLLNVLMELQQTNIDILPKTHENPWFSKEHELKSRIFHISAFSTFSQGIFLEGILVT